MIELTANEVVAQRLREARESAGLSQAKLSKRLTDVVGYDMSRQAIAEIETAGRRVNVDEWLALAAALGVCPLYMVTPLESEEIISEEAAEEGIFEPTTHLRVGEKLTLIPREARQWVRGKAIYDDAPLDDWPTYYCVQVPPAVRYRLRLAAAYARDHWDKLGRWSLPPIELPEEKENEMAVPGLKGRGVPQSLWTWIKSERELEEES